MQWYAHVLKIYTLLLVTKLTECHIDIETENKLFDNDINPEYLSAYLAETFFTNLNANPMLQVRFASQLCAGVCRLLKKTYRAETGECEISVNELASSPYSRDGEAELESTITTRTASESSGFESAGNLQASSTHKYPKTSVDIPAAQESTSTLMRPRESDSTIVGQIEPSSTRMGPQESLSSNIALSETPSTSVDQGENTSTMRKPTGNGSPIIGPSEATSNIVEQEEKTSTIRRPRRRASSLAVSQNPYSPVPISRRTRANMSGHQKNWSNGSVRQDGTLNISAARKQRARRVSSHPSNLLTKFSDISHSDLHTDTKFGRNKPRASYSKRPARKKKTPIRIVSHKTPRDTTGRKNSTSHFNGQGKNVAKDFERQSSRTRHHTQRDILSRNNNSMSTSRIQNMQRQRAKPIKSQETVPHNKASRNSAANRKNKLKNKYRQQHQSNQYKSPGGRTRQSKKRRNSGKRNLIHKNSQKNTTFAHQNSSYNPVSKQRVSANTTLEKGFPSAVTLQETSPVSRIPQSENAEMPSLEDTRQVNFPQQETSRAHSPFEETSSLRPEMQEIHSQNPSLTGSSSLNPTIQGSSSQHNPAIDNTNLQSSASEIINVPGVYNAVTGVNNAKTIAQGERIIATDATELVAELLSGETDNELFPELFLNRMKIWVCRLFALGFNSENGECEEVSPQTHPDSDETPMLLNLSPLADGVLSDLMNTADPDGDVSYDTSLFISILYDSAMREAYTAGVDFTALETHSWQPPNLFNY